MKAQINDRTYTIEFAYGTRLRCGRTGEWTECLIRDVTNWEKPVAARPPVVASGEVTRYHTDRPDRMVARKRALAIAIEELFPPAEDSARSEEIRQKRRALWECYFNRKIEPVAPLTATAPSTAAVDPPKSVSAIQVGLLIAFIALFVAQVSSWENASRKEREVVARMDEVTERLALAEALVDRLDRMLAPYGTLPPPNK